MKIVIIWDDLVLALLLFGALRVANNTKFIAQPAGKAIMSATAKTGATSISTNSHIIAPVSSYGKSILTKVSSSSTKNKVATTVGSDFMKKSHVKPNSHNSHNLTRVDGDMYPRLSSPSYIPLIAIRPEGKLNSNLEFISNRLVYNVVGIYKTIEGTSNPFKALILKDSYIGRLTKNGITIFFPEKTIAKGDINYYETAISTINKDQMTRLLRLTHNNWKPFLFENIKVIISNDDLVVKIYNLTTNIDKLFSPETLIRYLPITL